MTHPTDEELDALVRRLNQLDRRMSFQSQNITGARTCRLSADAITTLRAQLAEVQADRDKWFEGWGAMHVAAMREAQRADQNAIRAEQAELHLGATQDKLEIERALTDGAHRRAREAETEAHACGAEREAWKDRADRAEAALAAQIEADAGMRKRIATAIFDPGSTEGYKGERTLTEWQVDAVVSAIRNQPNDRSALDRLLAEAREQALREAADTVMQKTHRPHAPKDFRDGYDVSKADVATAIFALIDGDEK